MSATDLAQQGERVVSIDEMSGIQALQRQLTDAPTKPGQIKRREFEYIRHGTQCLIGNFDVHFNDSMAKPFQWTFKGKLLAV